MKFLIGVLFLVISNPLMAGSGFSHIEWSEVLQQVVDERGFVDYQALYDAPEMFERYIDRIERFSPDSHPDLFPTAEHELAYFINAYNAQVFKGVLERGPEKKSVWRGLISGHAFFVRMKILVGGETTNLKSLEDDIIRAEFNDPRIHAAINCASISCPRLLQTAYLPETLDQQLDDAMREFVNSSQHVRIDGDTVYLSKIFKWFEDDFLDYERAEGNNDATLLDYINRYRDAPLAENIDIRFLPYDKGINSQ